MSNPQPFGIGRTQRLTLATATTLLLAVAVVLSVGLVPPRPAEAALAPGEELNMYPVVHKDNPSVVVSERQTATNTGTFYDPADDVRGIPSDYVRITVSVGSITQSGDYDENGFYRGTWSWWYKTPDVPTDETKTVTITATDSRGARSSASFSLTVKEGPPANDSFSGALDLATIRSSTTDGTTLATMEAGEPRPYSPTKDCGITGVSNSVWFKFTYGGQGGLPQLPSPNAYYNFDTQGSNFDTVLALYEGSSVNTLKQIECSNDNGLPNWNDNLSVPQSKLSVGHTYYVQLTGTGGARSGKYQLHYEPRGLTQPKVMAYNIVKGEFGGGLPAVADTIRAMRPDIVLLNEIREYSSLETDPPYDVWNQTKYLANEAGFPYFRYEGCTLQGINGTSGVAILSRYPITGSTSWDLPDSDPILDHWCILKADISIGGLNHHVFSTRFNWEEDNREQQEAAIDIVRSMPSTDPVIVGGDFNSPWNERPYAKELWEGSGLTDALGAAGLVWTKEDPYYRKDYIYFRGPYSVYEYQHMWSQHLGLPEASDHAFAFAHFLRRSADTQAPKVTSTVPAANATGVAPGVNVTATFSEDMDVSSINRTTFKLMKAGTTTSIGAVVSYEPTTRKATLNPNADLQLGTKYKAVVTAGAKDLTGNALDQDLATTGSQPKQWVFTVRN